MEKGDILSLEEDQRLLAKGILSPKDWELADDWITVHFHIKKDGRRSRESKVMYSHKLDRLKSTSMDEYYGAGNFVD